MSYSLTLLGYSPGSSILDNDSMAGIFDDEESDLRDIVMLYQVEERKAARQQQQQMIQIVASLGGNARVFRRERARNLDPSHRGRVLLPTEISALAKE